MLKKFLKVVLVMKSCPSVAQKSLVLSLMAMIIFCVSLPVVAQDDERPVIVVPRGGGKETFTRFCTTCHMPDGRGGQSEGGYGADLRITLLSVDEVTAVITNGRQSKGMPAFKGIVDDEKIQLTAQYVKTVIKLKN
jgi:mono/diheme cytochrome c family protein